MVPPTSRILPSSAADRGISSSAPLSIKLSGRCRRLGIRRFISFPDISSSVSVSDCPDSASEVVSDVDSDGNELFVESEDETTSKAEKIDRLLFLLVTLPFLLSRRSNAGEPNKSDGNANLPCTKSTSTLSSSSSCRKGLPSISPHLLPEPHHRLDPALLADRAETDGSRLIRIVDWLPSLRASPLVLVREE